MIGDIAVRVAVLLGVHLAAFAIWVGFSAAFLVVGVSAVALLRVCLVAMPMTLASGWALAFVQYGTPGAWPWSIRAMQTGGLAMAVVLLIAWFGGLLLVRDAQAVGDGEALVIATRRLTRLIGVSLVLGVGVLGFAVAGNYG